MMSRERGICCRWLISPVIRTHETRPIPGPGLSERLGDVSASLKGSATSVLIAKSDLNHSRRVGEHEVEIERGANLVRATS